MYRLINVGVADTIVLTLMAIAVYFMCRTFTLAKRNRQLHEEIRNRINLRNLEVNALKDYIYELRDCYNQYDKCTIWECNCI